MSRRYRKPLLEQLGPELDKFGSGVGN
jgi:hypothetical protein